MLAPRIDEIIDGSQRAQQIRVLDMRMADRGIDSKWYRDLRRYGSVPHAGVGLGFERTLAYVTGPANVRDAIPFRRTPGECKVLVRSPIRSNVIAGARPGDLVKESVVQS